jgi:hypothetical protein
MTMQHPSTGESALTPTGRAGRALLSALLAAIVASVFVWNLPASRARSLLLPAARPLVLGLGLQQRWRVFAPNPPDHSVFIDVVVQLEDGSDWRATIPGSDPFLGALRDYRWRKWAARVSDERRQHLWSAAAGWFARQHAPARSVILHRRRSPTPEPGSGEPRRWKSFAFFELTRSGPGTR